MIVPLKDAARTAQHALRSFQYGNFSTELAAEAADYLEENMQAIRIAQEDHPYVLEWLAKASEQGGGFVSSFANAALVADWQNSWLLAGDEGERQVILLALAKLALERPGWDSMLGEIADRLQGRPMFEEFKRVDVPPIVAAVGRLRKVAKQCGASGHTSRERMLTALADEFESESFGAGESTKGRIQRENASTPAPEAQKGNA